MLPVFPIIAAAIGRAVIPAALGAIGINNAETIEQATNLANSGQPVESIQLTGDIWIDGLAILAMVSRIAYVQVKKKRKKQ